MDEKILQSYIGLNPECNQPYIYIYIWTSNMQLSTKQRHCVIIEAWRHDKYAFCFVGYENARRTCTSNENSHGLYVIADDD